MFRCLHIHAKRNVEVAEADAYDILSPGVSFATDLQLIVST